MQVPNLNFASLNQELPDYFRSKLHILEGMNAREDLIEAERSRYNDAVNLANSVGKELIPLLNLAKAKQEEQMKKAAFLRNSQNQLMTRSPMFLSAVAYICHENEEPIDEKSIPKSDIRLPKYFLKRLPQDEKRAEMLAIFDAATRITEASSFKPAAVIQSNLSSLTDEKVLWAIRYASYVREAPKTRKVRLLTSRGSRKEVLST